jgi:hypothetical protein
VIGKGGDKKKKEMRVEEEHSGNRKSNKEQMG